MGYIFLALYWPGESQFHNYFIGYKGLGVGHGLVSVICVGHMED